MLCAMSADDSYTPTKFTLAWCGRQKRHPPLFIATWRNDRKQSKEATGTIFSIFRITFPMEILDPKFKLK